MGRGCSAGVGAPVGLGKCNSSSKPGVGAEGEARGMGETPGSAVESVGFGGATVRIPRCGGPRPAAPAAARARLRAGAHLCGPPAAARPPARSQFPPKPQKSQCSPRVATLFGER